MNRAAVLLRDEAHDAQQMLRSGASEMPVDARLLYPEELRRIHGIEGSHRQSLCDELPDQWTVDHLSKRLVEAARIFKRLAGPAGPKKPGNHWPETKEEWEDLLAQQTLPDHEKRARGEARVRKWARGRITPEEIRLAEGTQSWLLDLRRDQAKHAIVLMHWAAWKALNLNVSELCGQLGWPTRSFYNWRDKGLEWIVNRLNAKRVSVF